MKDGTIIYDSIRHFIATTFTLDRHHAIVKVRMAMAQKSDPWSRMIPISYERMASTVLDQIINALEHD